MDDGSLERLLVAEPVPLCDSTPGNDYTPMYFIPFAISIYSDTASSKSGWRTPPRSRSPSAQRKASIDRMAPRSRVSDLEQLLGEAVNNIVKSFYRCDKDVSRFDCLSWCMSRRPNDKHRFGSSLCSEVSSHLFFS